MENLPDEFFEWLNECPVQWVRVAFDDDSASYMFYAPESE